MAKKPAVAEGTINPEATYELQLKKPVKHGKTWLRPGVERLRVSGATLLAMQQSNAEAIDVYKEI